MEERAAVIGRAAVALVVAAALVAPPGAAAQTAGKSARVGLLWPGSCPLRPPRMEAFRHGLAESGYVDGQNVTVELRCAEEKVDHLPQLAGELIALNVQVITAIGVSATHAVQRTATTIPLVALADELVWPGFVASVAKPGGNTTGVQVLAPEVNVKKLELLKQLVPTLSRVAVLADPEQSVSQLPALEEAARSLGVQLQVLSVRAESDIDRALQAARANRAGAVHVLGSPRLFAYSKTVIGLAARHRLPAVHEWREAVDAGGLASYGPNLSEMWRQTARVVGKVLKGARPADLPIEQPTKFELAINLKTARALGLTVPQSLLLAADHIVQ